ncbi:polysaccharide deacetylase [Helicobacter jaachi]|uniref:Polysaccharide deacetylase n=1 Tax=Helicobacter jaachi TaxID=1677920 RepID=A0A4U8TCG8_9HELI|nr:polysaccharide deacetylase family protein [Helicobacter jaachi]TLD97635.1 polysaccharide deacetylase [Helicobacter jaachi]
MRSKYIIFFIAFAIALVVLILGIRAYLSALPKENQVGQAVVLPSLEWLKHKYANASPKQWGEHFEGITSLLPDSQTPVVYLTFDACSGAYDRDLINYLIEQQVEATLFINSRWIDKHLEDFLILAQNPLFSIQNHGTKHRPLSVNGKSIYNIKGTDSIQGVYEEIMDNDRKIFELTGKRARYFRSGTAYYDEVAVSIAKDLGYKIGGFDVLGDGGATFSKKHIIHQAQKARNGSIIIYHLNQPQSETFEGIKEVVPLLREKGFTFKKLP